jgi:hypothetical protein
MKRPPIQPREVYIQEKSSLIQENQCLKYEGKDEQRRYLVKIAADHIAYIAEQIEHAKNKKEVKEL